MKHNLDKLDVTLRQILDSCECNIEDLMKSQFLKFSFIITTDNEKLHIQHAQLERIGGEPTYPKPRNDEFCLPNKGSGEK